MSGQAVKESQLQTPPGTFGVHTLDDDEFQTLVRATLEAVKKRGVPIEYSGPPRESRSDRSTDRRHTTMAGEKEIIKIQTRDTSRPGQMHAVPLRPRRYRFDSHEDRITDVGLRLCAAVVLAVLAIVGGGGWALFWGCFAFGALFCALERSFRPYEIFAEPSGELQLVSLAGTTKFRADDILGIVRRERQSNRSLSSVRVAHRRGSVTLDGHEDVVEWLMALRPTAQVSTEVYDDTD